MATYYCSGQNGNDSNNGTTVALARKTIDSALGLMSAGDTLYIGPATYREQLTTGDFTAGSGEGSETKIIGDPDGNIFVGELPGPVRITAKDTWEKSDDGVSYTLGCTSNHIHFHNLFIEGPGAEALSTTGNSTSDFGYTVYIFSASNLNNQMWFDCVCIGGAIAVRSANTNSNLHNSPVFVRCFAIASLTGFSIANTIHCISIARTNYTYGNHHGSIAIGGSYGFQNCVSTAHGTAGTSDFSGVITNCMVIGSSYSLWKSSGTNNVVLGGGFVGFDDTGQNLKPNGLWIGHTYRGTNNAEEHHPHENIYYSQNYANDYSSDGMVGTLGGGIIINPNIWHHLVKAFKPYDGFTTDYSNNVTSHGMQGWFSASADDYNPTTGSADAFGAGSSTANTIQQALTGSFDIQGNPYRPGNIRTVGPWTYVSSSLNQSTTSGSNPSIQIGGFGTKIFDLPVSSSTNFTASVAVKYNSGEAPRLELTGSGVGFGFSSKITGSSFSITPQSVSATGTGDQTGAFQTLKVSSSVNMNDRVQIKLVQPDDDDASYAIFAQLKVE